jgi:hypothetical protein
MFSWPYSKSYIWSSIILWALFLMALMAVVYGRSVGWPVTVLWSLALVVVAAWSPLEEFFGLPHVPMWLIYPLFWGLFGVVSPFIRGSVA